MQLSIEIRESAANKVLYLLRHRGDDVTIISQGPPQIEPIDESDPDMRYIKEAEKRRSEGEALFDIDDVIKALQ